MPRKKTEINDVAVEHLKREMETNELRIKDVAIGCHVSPSLISQILHKQKPLTRENAELLGALFKVRPEYLMGDSIRTEEEYINQMNIFIKDSASRGIPIISGGMALTAFFNETEIKEESQILHDGKEIVYKLSKGSKDYYITSDQRREFIKMIDYYILDHILPVCEMLQTGNRDLKSEYEKAIEANKETDQRSTEEILKEIEEIRDDPEVIKIDF